VYPVLHRLERGGFLSSEWTEVAGRRRRVYRLTRSGRRELGLRKNEWNAFSRAVQAVLA
jgi:PadR family transcriptional regulator PadR